MSRRRWGWLLLCCCAALLSARRGIPAVFPWAALIWIFAAVSPAALRWHPAAGAWIGWVLWIGVSACFSGGPGEKLDAWAWEATCVLIFLLAHTWWVGAHRRAWAIGLWGVVPFAAFFWPKAQAACLLSAAAAACCGIWAGPPAGLPRWRRELALAGACALVFVLRFGSWGAWFGFFVSVALCAAQSGLKERRAVPAVLVVAGAAWAALSFGGKILGGTRPYLLDIAAETGWAGLGLYACAALASAPGNFAGLSWEGRAAAAALYELLAQSFVDGAPGGPGLEVVFFSAIACASNWARAHEESSAPRLAEERHAWTKPVWAGASGLLLCLAAAAFQRSKARLLAEAGSKQSSARIAALARLADLEPSNAQTRLRLARELLFAQPSRIGAPLMRLDEALRLEPGNPLYLALKAELFLMAGDWRRAEQWAGRALAARPRFAEAHLMLAEALSHRNNREEARRELSLAKRIHDLSSAGEPGLEGWDQGRYGRLLKELGNVPP